MDEKLPRVTPDELMAAFSTMRQLCQRVMNELMASDTEVEALKGEIIELKGDLDDLLAIIPGGDLKG